MLQGVGGVPWSTGPSINSLSLVPSLLQSSYPRLSPLVCSHSISIKPVINKPMVHYKCGTTTGGTTLVTNATNVVQVTFQSIVGGVQCIPPLL